MKKRYKYYVIIASEFNGMHGKRGVVGPWFKKKYAERFMQNLHDAGVPGTRELARVVSVRATIPVRLRPWAAGPAAGRLHLAERGEEVHPRYLQHRR